MKVTRARLHCKTHRLCDPDRHQRCAGVLHAGAYHARRSAGGGAAGGCLSGTRKSVAYRLRLRSSVAGSVRAMAVESGQRRSRSLNRHRATGTERSDARRRQYRDIGHRRGSHRVLAGIVLRIDRRLLPRHLDRQGSDIYRDRRRFAPALLARNGAGDHLLGAAELVACGGRRAGRLRRVAVGLGAYPLPRSAGHHDRSDTDGNRHAHHAGADRRHIEPGFRRGPARQRPARTMFSATSSRTRRRPRWP